jgi:hypothetical protein
VIVHIMTYERSVEGVERPRTVSHPSAIKNIKNPALISVRVQA